MPALIRPTRNKKKKNFFLGYDIRTRQYRNARSAILNGDVIIKVDEKRRNSSKFQNARVFIKDYAERLSDSMPAGSKENLRVLPFAKVSHFFQEYEARSVVLDRKTSLNTEVVKACSKFLNERCISSIK